ncbi:ABC transporter substrate-binding protein [Neobacillus bataviensis]|uniref:ABC transporter substrate-binding protein n=1 Tax=Neobacillus bataviensis TaxID=220685 RepID=UPI001CBE5A86|nr:extracellular solute-binding protein [Neobacillus bataviensis]
MKKGWKMLAASVFAGTLILSGCSSKTEEKTAGKSTDSKQEDVTLTMGSWRTEDTEAYKTVIAEFNKKYPNIHIEFKPSKNTEYNTLLNTALQSGEGPDLIHLRPYGSGISLGDEGFLEPLNGLKGLDTFDKELLQASQSKDGKQYGVPLNISTTQIFYNKAIFKKYKLDVPKTWDEFIKVADTLKSKKVTPIAYGTKESWLLSLLHGMVGPGQFGGKATIDDLVSGKKQLNDPSIVKSFEVLKDLDKYFPENSQGLGMDDIRTLFATEQAAMLPMGSWEIQQIRSLNPDLDFGFFPIPSATGGNPTVTRWVDGSYALNAKSKHKEEAKKFLEFMTTKEFGNKFANEFKMISAVPGVSSDDALVDSLTKAANSDAVPYFWLVNFALGEPSTKGTLETELQGMYLNKTTPADVAAKVKASADTWFKPQN